MAKILECGAAAVAVRTQRFVPDSPLEEAVSGCGLRVMATTRFSIP
jgi:hypothetical protein